MSLAVQSALADGHRRLEISLPDGLCFGLFGEPPGKQLLGDPDLGVAQNIRARADSELAYLASEIFQNLGDSAVCVVPDDSTLALVKRSWAGRKLPTRIVGSAASLADRSATGFGRSSVRGSPPRVILALRANKKLLADLQPVISPLADEVLVILLNPARLKSGGSRSGYVPAFVLRDNPHPEWRGGLLYRRYPEQWALAVAAAGGRAVVHGQSEERPSLDEIDTGFRNIKSDKSLISQAGGILSAAGAAAALERRA